MKGALTWFAVWLAVALIGTWLLNPLILPVLLVAAILEIIYCKLLKVTCWRTLISGLVKSAGPIAAVFVVVTQPGWPLIILMVIWLILWEVGGQNIPADWNDVEEDKALGARTIPLVLGPYKAGWLALFALMGCVALSLLLPLMSPLPLGWGFQLACVIAGVVLLVDPAIRLLTSSNGQQASHLFDSASLYPSVLLAIILVCIVAS